MHGHTQLGFVEGEFPPGVHVCHVFSDDEERDRALHGFLCAGLKSGAQCGCFSDHYQESTLARELAREGVMDAAGVAGTLTVSGTNDAYFAEGSFRPELMLSRLAAFHEEAARQGRNGARIIGEMTPAIEHVPGGSRLLEYEARVSLLLREHPITTVCQYDARTFDGASIMDVLRVHPYVVVQGFLVENPFFLDPQQLLEEWGGQS